MDRKQKLGKVLVAVGLVLLVTSVVVGIAFSAMSGLGRDPEEVDADLWTKLDMIDPEDNPEEYKRILNLIERRREAREMRMASAFPVLMMSWAIGLLFIVAGGIVLERTRTRHGRLRNLKIALMV